MSELNYCIIHYYVWFYALFCLYFVKTDCSNSPPIWDITQPNLAFIKKILKR